MKFHKTKDGKEINLADLEMSHLENILKWIERKAKEGLTVRMGGGSCADDMWYHEEIYYGEEAKSQLKFSDYKAEFERRVSGITFDWDKFAKALKDEFGESLVEEDGGEEDAYNWWLTDVTVTDIVDFIKNYR